MESGASQLSSQVRELGLERYVLELETDGLTIVPPEVTGMTPEFVDHCCDVLLARFKELTGCDISLEDGPLGELRWPESTPSLISGKTERAPTQTLIQNLLQLDRCFRDLAVNPAVDALIDHLIGEQPAPAVRGRARRLSSTNAFVKWQGDYGYGDGLGLHPDQGNCPQPWGSTALNANATWCLTDYTKEGGALAYVPGSHRKLGYPVLPRAAEKAVAAEAPRGSVLVFHGATWHGAYPKKTPGLRLNAVAYYRHASVLPQENLSITMRDQPWHDCDNPELLEKLVGLKDGMPYLQQGYELPSLAADAPR